MKHTKGEWVARPNPSDSKKYGIWIQHPTRGTSLIAMAQMDFMTEEELKANTKLMAAAPELLEALQDVLTVFEERETAIPVSTQIKIEQAIKKATL